MGRAASSAGTVIATSTTPVKTQQAAASTTPVKTQTTTPVTTSQQAAVQTSTPAATQGSSAVKSSGANSASVATPVAVNSGNTSGAISVNSLMGGGGAAAVPVEETPIETTPLSSSVNSTAAEAIKQYLANYNQDREQKIRDMYAGNIAAQNAQQKTAYDTSASALKNAYDANLASQRASYDEGLGTLKTNYDENLGNLLTAYNKNTGTLKNTYDENTGNLKVVYDKNTGTLKTTYDKNLGALGNAYQQNLSDAETALAKISPQYQESMNALAADYERQRRNLNMQGAVNGLNTGAGSQLALGQNMAYMSGQSNLARSENEALNEANRGIQNLNRDYANNVNLLEQEYNNNYQTLTNEYNGKLENLDKGYNNSLATLEQEYNNNLATLGTKYSNQRANMETANQNAINALGTKYQNDFAALQQNYQNKIAEAAANNNYQLAAALLDEYGAQYDRTMAQAEQLADYGDFSMYANIYGVEAASEMERIWGMQNPDLAYNLGRITADEYYNYTGKYPNDASGAYGSGSNLQVGTWQPTSGTGSGAYYKRSYGRGRDRAYRGAAGYYTTDGNFYVPDTGKFYGSAEGRSIEPANQAAADNLAKIYGWTGA